MGINMDMDELLVKVTMRKKGQNIQYGLIKYKEQIYMISLKRKCALILLMNEIQIPLSDFVPKHRENSNILPPAH